MYVILLKMYTLLFYCIVNIVIMNMELLYYTIRLSTMNRVKSFFHIHIVFFRNVCA